MSKKESQEKKKMVETAKYLAENDPQSLLIAKSNMDILKARCDLAKQRKVKEEEVVTHG